MAKKKTRKDGLIEKVYQGKHFYGHSESEIQDKILAYRTKQEAGYTFEEVADAYENYICGADSPIRQGSMRSYLPMLNRVREYFGNTQINAVEPSDIRRFLETLKKKDFKSKTIMNAKTVTSCVFSYWCAEMHGDKNPVQFSGLPSNMNRSERREPPTDQQTEKINANTGGDGFWAQLFRYTGMRLGEANALTWADVDFDSGMITIDKAAPWNGNAPYIAPTKTVNSVRKVPIIKAFIPMLKDRSVGHGADEYVMSETAKPLTRSQYYKRWEAYCKMIGLVESYPHTEKIPATQTRPARVVQRNVYKATVTAHQFRHLYATALFEAGIPDLVAQRLLGHADISTTKKIYQHFRESTMPEYAEKLNTYFSAE